MNLKTRVARGSLTAVIFIVSLASQTPNVMSAVLPLPFTNAPSILSEDSLWQQITNGGYPTLYAGTTNDSKTFRGVFRTTNSNVRLALHSDDGSTVTVDGQPTGVSDLGTDTHLKERGSLKTLTTTFVPDQEYCVQIEYSNQALTTNDQDGVTLYAYNGGGTASNGPRVAGPDAVCVGVTTNLVADCGTAPYSWSNSSPAVLNLTSSGGITGLSNGTATVTVRDAESNATARTIFVVKPGISPGSLTTCVGVTNTFLLTNSAGTGIVTWSQSGLLTGNGRTNSLALTNAGTNTLTASYAGCSVLATVIVVAVSSLLPVTTNFCGSGTVVYTNQTTPAGFSQYVNWGGEGLFGTGASRTNSYSGLGPHIVSNWCGTSVKYSTVTVYRIDIAQTSATMLADATAPMMFNLTNSFGTATWQISPGGGPSVSGSGDTVTVSPGSTAGAYTLTACASELSSCCDTATIQVVKVTFATSLVAFCEGTNASVAMTVASSNFLSSLTFDTVTNVAAGTPNTVASVTVASTTNLILNPVSPGTATLRVRLGNSTSFGPVVKVVRVTFPTNAWYVLEGKQTSFSVTITPPDAPVTYTTKEAPIATASGSGANVTVNGVTNGTTQVVAVVGNSGCAQKDVTVVRFALTPQEVDVCINQSENVNIGVLPTGTPFTVLSANTNVARVTQNGSTVTVTGVTNGRSALVADLQGTLFGLGPVNCYRVTFATNEFFVGDGDSSLLGVEVLLEVEVDPALLGSRIRFIAANTNVAQVSGGPPQLTVTGLAVGSTEIQAWIGTNQLCATKLATVYHLRLLAVGFFGTNYSSVLRDDGGGQYTTNNTHWTPSTNYPVAFARNSQPAVSAVFSFTGSVTRPILIRGDGSYSIPISSNTPPSGGYIVTPILYSPNAFPNQIDYLSGLTITWKASFDNGVTYLPAGMSVNRVYVTWSNSLNAIHTLLDVGCTAAKGVAGAFGVNEQAVLDAIWSNKILTKNIHRASDGATLSYYGFYDVNGNGLWDSGVDTNYNNTTNCLVYDAETLIRVGNGQCGAWANFLRELLRCQGISAIGTNSVVVQGMEIKGAFNSFAVKNWAVTGSSARTIISFDAGVDGLSALIPNPAANEAADAPGATGQGNSPNPPSRFFNHYIVRLGQTLYDPSYALGPFTDRKKYELAAFAGRIAGNTLSDAPADDSDPANHNDEINNYP